ncbi:MAG: tetratricopeptide repeat protein [Terracidiphilus sp.]|jgi:TPR repeat protein
MRILGKQSVLTMAFSLALIPAFAQAPAIDPTLLAKANAGDAAAQVQLGDNYRAAGDALPHHPLESAEYYKQASDWYRKAADQGFIPAELHLAALYRDGGKGFPRDATLAAGWYRKAAEQGDVSAQASLGVLYSIGVGVPRNDSEAYFWLDLAASVPGPNQQKYAANRQLIGTHITTEELDAVQDRVAKWLAAHPPTAKSE